MLWGVRYNPGQTVTAALTEPSSSLGRIWGARKLLVKLTWC